MRPQPFVNKYIRSTIPNNINAQHLAVAITYRGKRRETPIINIDIYASPILSYNYNLEYESSSELLPKNQEGYIHPISLFNLSGNSGFFGNDELDNAIINKEYVFYDDKVWSYDSYYESIIDFITDLRVRYKWNGVIDSDCGFFSPALEGYVKPKTEAEMAAESMMELIDNNSNTIPEGDYLKMCDVLSKIRKM